MVNPKLVIFQELYALGLTNLVGSLFSCFPTAASLSRSSLLESMGGHSQLASVFSSLIILVVIIWLAPLFKTLPTLCLASIIVVALKNMLFQVKDCFKLWKINRYEAITWLMTFLGTVVLDVDAGLFIGIGTSILVVVFRDMFSPIKAMVKYKNTSNYVDNELVHSDSSDETESSFRDENFQSNVKHSIYFANCHTFQDHLYKTYGFRPQKKNLIDKKNSISNISGLAEEMNGERRYQDIVLDFSGVNYVDTNGMQVIRQVVDDYKCFDIHVLICEAQDIVILPDFFFQIEKFYLYHIYEIIKKKHKLN
ncbi:solute carrier family 26 member 6-like [Brachionus plicatilis]|uniref:Solute carrier family 26 member 6-like n=1 Tax=Brachionus plicatilis TaxID=10195 RepID=A0A3M7QS27_BRAPC|nr:solute carrier family 26 member 6-like [Brachionus plicatilis]